MRPVDPRLLRHARATRGFLAASVALGLAGAGLVIAQALLIARLVADAFTAGRGLGDGLAAPLLLLAATAAGRGLVAWLTELAAHRAAASVKSELRLRLLHHATRDPAAPLRPTGELTALATRGIDALDGYFARYLPQLGLAVLVPAAVLARIVTDDWAAAATIAVTLPLIPLFMALIGWATQAHMDRQWRQLARLSGHFLDVVAGLSTLKVFGRARAQEENIRAVTDSYRRGTLRTLRISFLSSFALELLATLSVALVAVGIGMRLVHGDLDLYTGLVVLILAPEAYLPLRRLGAEYHAAQEGLAAAQEVFSVVEAAPEPRPGGGLPVPAAPGLAFEGLAVRYPGRSGDALAPTSLVVAPGETVALTGPSGVGKSTLLAALLGFAAPASGRVLIGGVDLALLDRAEWHRRVAWVPQRPYLCAGTVADNVRLARPEADDAAVAAALREAAASELDPGRRVGEGGAGLSAGQRQRVALARAFLADRPVLLLDEPTAALDAATEAAVTESIRRHAATRTALLITHRPALLAAADRTFHVERSPAAGSPPGAAAPAPGALLRPTGAEGPVPGGTALACADAPAGGGVVPAERDGAHAGLAEPVGPGRSPAVGSRPSDALRVRRTEVVPCHSRPRSARAGWRRRIARTLATRLASPAPCPSPADAASRRGASGGALRWVREAGRRWRERLVLSGLLGAFALGSSVGLMATSGWLISRAWEQPPVLHLMVAVTATRAFGLGRAVFRYAERLTGHDAVLRVLAGLRVAVYRRLERLAPAGLGRARRGDLLARVVGDVDALQDYYLRWLLPAATAAAVGLGATALTWALLPAAGAALAAGLLAAGVAVPALTAAVSRRAERRLAPARGELAARTVDLLSGTPELTVAGALPARRAAVRAADAELTALAARSAAATALGGGLSALLAGLTVTAAAWAAVPAVAGGRLDGVWLATVVLVPLAAFEAVAGLPLAVQHRQRARRAAERVREVCEAPTPVREPEHPEPAPASPFPLRVRGLSARHPGQAGYALRGVDLDLAPGRRIAVVGPSGAGKTTLAHCLLRFLDPEPGSRYTLGGAEATALDGDAVRRLVGLCAQDAHLFDSTLRENLRLARPGADDAALLAALAAARLLTWADALPAGLDTPVGEHGARLSGGQRQRLALARALLADFPVLVLDEPAEHLDLPTADALTADLLAATEGRATVLITHRLAGLEAVDEVLVLEDGRVAQRGAPAELAAVEGPYRRLLERERIPTFAAERD
ncbi:thiol reductant ABC exporter subunit CydD [Streptomyces sp. DSM 44917]|uniref:Thiol reductant ABC exporter subunit CydD n=1 Tax=Streptomyces boetiae TaxID=3075541 RepID=A0ABU2LEK2_9ACTN|nr:thiol reductant ABC exporter subunit CydD [Streptomyces sp. DSM 44917]MDT0310010.1 thiol reductant ABC exporter subunit CydD [Streptomyces sp. DSM 44917]